MAGSRMHPAVKAWFDKVDARPAAARASAYATKFEFKKDNDETAMRAMFPQNY